MALVITNGEYYAVPNRNGGVNKTNDITEAQVFSNVNTAAEKLKKHKGYLKGYYVWDTEGERVQPRRIRIKRKHFSQEVRKLLYQQAEGKCALCGKKITFDEMELDHIIPISMGGADEVENLQVCCMPDNRYKANILPSDFFTSFTTDFSRSSNSPLYLAPATSAPISSEYTCLFFRFSGTSPRRIRCANPSTIAVLPVPGSPINIGLFFVRRLKI